MKITERKLAGTYEIELNPLKDERGFFMRTFDSNIFSENDINRNWVQENHSRSEKKNVIRGLHFQIPPHCEAKLVRCIHGAVYDVFVDLRESSSTFGQWDSIELTGGNNKMIFIPRGFAHGFCTLTDVSEVIYKVDNLYSSFHERGLIWNDPQIGIRWPLSTPPTLSKKDELNLSFDEFVNDIGSIILE